MDFQNKTILVTGASRGIGAAIAKAFAAESAAVAVNYLNNKEAADATVAACEAAGATFVFKAWIFKPRTNFCMYRTCIAPHFNTRNLNCHIT